MHAHAHGEHHAGRATSGRTRRPSVLLSYAITAASCLGVLLLALAPHTAFALGDRVVFDQDASGVISAHLVGFIDACHGDHYFPMNPASVNSSGTAISISSPFAIVDPPPCPSPPGPYQVTATLGKLADGAYSVVWSVGPRNYPGAFVVQAGALVAVDVAVPALDPRFVAALVALVAIAGWWLGAQRRPR